MKTKAKEGSRQVVFSLLLPSGALVGKELPPPLLESEWPLTLVLPDQGKGNWPWTGIWAEQGLEGRLRHSRLREGMMAKAGDHSP